MRRFIIDLDDTLAYTTRDIKGDPKRIPLLTLIPGALEFLRIHHRKCILLTAGVETEQQQKIDVLDIRKCFRRIYVVKLPQDKPKKLEEIVLALKNKTFGISAFNVVVIGDRLDIEIRKGNQLGCVTVRIKVPGGRHTDKMALGPLHEVPHFEAENFEELMGKFKYFTFAQ